jgi:hypothetical protein
MDDPDDIRPVVANRLRRRHPAPPGPRLFFARRAT